jgi:hypothetical protein
MSTLSIQFLVSCQLDFIGTADEMPELWKPRAKGKKHVHVGAANVVRLRSPKEGLGDPLTETALNLLHNDDTKVFVISDEDWHTTDCQEFDEWGCHCQKATKGARLPSELEGHRWHRQFRFIRANSLNVATDPRYLTIMKELTKSQSNSEVRIGILGVYTHLKVDYLVMNLITLAECSFKAEQIKVCEALCASPDKNDHDAAIRKFRSLGVECIESIADYRAWMTSVDPRGRRHR